MSENIHNLMEEFKELRQEGARKNNFVERLILTTIAGNLAIYSFAFTLQSLSPLNAFIALLPIILTTMSYFWILRSLYSGLRIVKYIKEQIEPATGLGWEGWLQKPREKTQSDGKIKWWEDVFGLFYHFFFGVSLILCIVLIFLPHWPYNNNTGQSSTNPAQFSPIPVSVCFLVAIGIVLLCLLWYFVAKWLWIDRRIKDIERLNREMRLPSRKDSDDT